MSTPTPARSLSFNYVEPRDSPRSPKVRKSPKTHRYIEIPVVNPDDIIPDTPVSSSYKVQLRHSLGDLNDRETINIYQNSNWMRLWESIGPFNQASNYIITWDFVILFFVMYNAISIPIRFGFRDLWVEDPTFHNIHVFFLFVDYIADACYLMDIVLNFRMAYMDHGILHTDTKKMAMHYLKRKFFWDALAVLPIDFFSFRISTHALLRVNRLIRLNRVLEYFNIWEFHTKHSHAVLFVKLFGGIFLYLHWMCCFYMAIAYYSGFGPEWCPPEEYYDQGFWSQYLWGLFWATKATTGLGGETPAPENDLQRGYTLMTSVMSQFIAGYIIGSIVNLISTINESTEEFRNKMANINVYMQNKKIPSKLTDKVRDYYNHLWSRQGGIEDDSIWSELPTRLRTELSMCINGGIITKVPFFKNCNAGFINSVVQLLRPEILTPGDFVVSEGDVGSEMFFVSQGELEVIVKNRVISLLGEGSFFGEIAVLFESKRTASIRAKTYCDLFVLRKSDLDKVLKSFPEERSKIKEMGELRMSKDSLRNHIREDALFHDVNEEEFYDELQDCFNSQTFAPGECVYKIGDQSDKIYFLGAGTLTFEDEDGETTRVMKATAIGEGFFFGYLDFLLDQPRTHFCKVSQRCFLLELRREEYERIVSKFPSAQQNIQKIIKISKNEIDLPELKNVVSYAPKSPAPIILESRKAKTNKNKKKGDSSLIDFESLSNRNSPGETHKDIERMKKTITECKSKLSKDELLEICKFLIETISEK